MSQFKVKWVYYVENFTVWVKCYTTFHEHSGYSYHGTLFFSENQWESVKKIIGNNVIIEVDKS